MTTAYFRQGVDRKQRHLTEEEELAGAEADITAYGISLASVTSFKYLERFRLAAYDDWPSVVRNLWKSQHKWEWLTRVMIREGADVWTLGEIYLAVVQSVMMSVLETWVMTPHIGRVLGRFHYRVNRRLTGKQPRQDKDIV